VTAALYNSPPFQYVNAIRVQDGRESVGDQYRDGVSAHATSRMVSLISSSVQESSDEVASSNTSNCGRRRRARAIESRCFSPPETFTPPCQSSSRARGWLSGADLRQQPGVRLPAFFVRGLRRTNCRFSRIDPENSCVSCVTNQFVHANLQLPPDLPAFRYKRYGHSLGGRGRPANFTKDVLPAPDGPTNAMSRRAPRGTRFRSRLVKMPTDAGS